VEINAELVCATIGAGDREGAYRLIEAVGASDFSTVYQIIRETDMSSADISVFWQEIIDSYRDVMVAKCSSRAKEYLDLTDGEYERVRAIAEKFSMAKLSYHTVLLEDALEDMQRANNSKRSIAEIALTRMCDPKLVASAESLAVRVEELEKQISLMKMGAIPIQQEEKTTIEKKVDEKPANEVKKSILKSTPVADTSELRPYENWGRVLERIGEIKRSLSSQFVSAKAFKTGNNTFVVQMSGFFANRIKNSASDMAILKGVIAEKEGVPNTEITVTVEEKINIKSDATTDFDNF